MTKKIKNLSLAIVFWLIVWELLAVIVNNQILVVGPVETVQTLFRLVPTTDFALSIGASFSRIMLGFLSGSLLGIVFAILAVRFEKFKIIISPFITMLKSIPVASFVILVIIWVGNGNISFIISLLVVMPIMYLSAEAGLSSIDIKMLEMADVFHMPLLSRIRYIYYPGLYPFLCGGFKTAIGMSWKSGVAAEVIGQPLHSLGNNLYSSKIYLATDEVLAWTLVIVLLSWLCEKIFLFLLGLSGRRFTKKEVSPSKEDKEALV